MEELKKQGTKRQDRLHRQGFGRAPVDDILAKIKDKLPDVCKEAGVDLIAWDIVHSGPSVEVVDVTDHLVKRFEPKESARKIIEELKKHEPLDDDQFPIDD
jgi:SOS response regulatory protein OraA/RecX